MMDRKEGDAKQADDTIMLHDDVNDVHPPPPNTGRNLDLKDFAILQETNLYPSKAYPFPRSDLRWY